MTLAAPTSAASAAASAAVSAASTFTVSDALWAALIAGVVAAAGVGISFWNTGRQLKHDRQKTADQLAHDRSEKNAERRLTLRRDIYLGLAAHLQDGLFAIGDYANSALDEKDLLKEWRKNAHFAAKLNLMGGGALLKAQIAVNQEIVAAIGQVNLDRPAMLQIRRRLEWLINRMEFHEAERDKALQQLQLQAREGRLSDGEQQRLLQVAAEQQTARDQTANNHDRLLLELSQLQRAAALRSLAHQQRLWPMFVDVARAARAELGEPFDVDAYKEALIHAKARTDALAGEMQVVGEAREREALARIDKAQRPR